MIAILKKELRQFFGSISGYIIISGFLILNSLWLWILDTNSNILNSGFADLTHFFTNTAWLFVIIIPALTMGSFSDEFKTGTIEILQTKPISTSKLVAGKFFAFLAIILCTLAPTLFYVYSIYTLALPMGNIDFGPLAGSYLGLIFLAGSFVSIGLWVSSYYKNQLVTILISIVLSFFLFNGIEQFPITVLGFNLEELGMSSHFTSISRGVIDSRDLMYFTCITLFFLTLSLYKISNRNNIRTLIYSIITIIVIHNISNSLYIRYDLTEDKKYTISSTSISILDDINEPAVIRVYLEGDFPPEFKRLQLETKQILEELKTKNKNLKVLFVDPKDNLQNLIQEGLTPSRLTIQEKGIVSEMVILPWATIQYKNKKENISLLKESSPKETQNEQLENSVQNLEYAFVNAVKKITSKKEKSIAIIDGNGQLEDIYLYSLLKDIGNYYHLAKFTLDSVETNPTKTLQQLKTYDLAILAKPSIQFSEQEKYCLDQYLLDGGNTIWMLDNVYAEMDSLYTSGKTLAYPRNLNLDDFFFRYGARVKTNLVKDLYASKIALATGNTGNKTNYQNFLWYYAPLVNTNNTHPIINNINPVKLNFVSSIDTLNNSIKKTVLLQSAQLSKTVETPAIIELNSVMEEPNPTIFNKGNQILGILLEGRFTSAYKDRIKPFDIKSPKEKGKDSKLVIIADGDIAKNQIHKGQPLELGIDKWTQEYFGNKEFLINTIEYLLDDTGLIFIRSKKIDLKSLDKSKVLKNRTYLQFVNFSIPIITTSIFAFLFFYFRKKKHSKTKY